MVGAVKYLHLLLVLSALIFILWGCCPMVLLSILAFLCMLMWPHDENVDCPHLYHVITWPEMRSCTLMVGVLKYLHLLGVLSALIFILWGCCPRVLLSILAFLCPPTWPSDENVDCPHLYHVITWPEMGSCTLMVGVEKYFHLFNVLSALICILWGCCPMVILSILAFLCPPTWPHDENVDCPHLYHVITWPEMGSCTLMVVVVKYLHLLGVLSALIFILWGCCPMVLLSILTLLCPRTCPHDEKVDCPHLYHVITWPEMLSWTMMFGVAKYLHLLGFLSTLIFIFCGCCPMVLLSILAFLCPPTWPHDENVDCPHLYHVITLPAMGSSSLMVRVVKYLHLLGVLSALIFVLWGCCPMVLLSILALLCPRTCPHDENVDCPHLYHVITWPEMGSWTMMFGVAKYLHLFLVFVCLIFIFCGCCPMVLLSILAFLCPPTWPHDENVYCPHLYHVITLPAMGSSSLMVRVVKYLHLLGVLSALIFVLWGCCPMVLLSILAFLCPPTWPHDENVDCKHLYPVITWPEMGSCTLMVGVVKYFHLLDVLSALIFIFWGCCPIVLLSILAFLCPPTWPSDENVDCPHQYHVITWPEMGSCTLIVSVVKYLHLLVFLSALIFILWCCCAMVFFVHFCFTFSAHLSAWRQSWLSTPVSCDHMTRNAIVDHDVWSSEIFASFFWFLSTLIFIFWGCCPMVLLSILAFLCPPTWPHDENVDCPHLYHVITWPEMVSCTLMVGAVKYLHLLMVVSALIFILWGCCPMVLLSILALLCPRTCPHDENVDCPHLYHVITWPEMGSWTMMFGVAKYLHLLGFLSAWFLSFVAVVLWCFCPFWLFSVRPRDRMTRMLIVHTCIMWSHNQQWDRAPWWLE